LGIEVDRAELERWLGWYMPERQPYLVPRDLADGLGLEDRPEPEDDPFDRLASALEEALDLALLHRIVGI
jgi:hypothetical protein